MTRLPPLTEAAVDERRRPLWDHIVSTRGPGAISADGSLLGPFNAWLYAPGMGAPLAQAGAALRFAGALDRRLHELAVITVAMRWGAEFQWYHHAHFARQAGLAEPIIDAVRAGLEPPFERDDERATHAVVTELLHSGTLAEATFANARRELGDEPLAELVALCGYSTTVAFTLNAFAVPAPA